MVEGKFTQNKDKYLPVYSKPVGGWYRSRQLFRLNKVISFYLAALNIKRYLSSRFNYIPFATFGNGIDLNPWVVADPRIPLGSLYMSSMKLGPKDLGCPSKATTAE